MNDCNLCQEWEICPFHPAAEPPPAAAAKETPVGELTLGGVPLRKTVASPSLVVPAALPTNARLLGPDDPEVLGPGVPPDLIYAIPDTGGVVGVPQTAKARTATFAIDLAAELRASGQHARATLLESWRRRYV